MTIANKLKIGDTIGVTAPSDPIIGDNIEELNNSKKILEAAGFKVKFGKNIYLNTNGYSATAKEKADDINSMFADKDVRMIWFAKGGENSNCVFDYLDYELIKNNPKIICGYSDITSLTNVINLKTGLVTFSGTNFKTISTDETNYSYQQAMNRFVKGKLMIGTGKEEYIAVREGTVEGVLIGGNISLLHGMVAGKYKLDFKDKILFIEELGYESEPARVSNCLAYFKQNGVFDKVNGIWVGNYEHESNISLEKILLDTIGDKYNIPIIKSNNFGHIETKTVIPIGTKAKIDTSKRIKIELVEECVK